MLYTIDLIYEQHEIKVGKRYGRNQRSLEQERYQEVRVFPDKLYKGVENYVPELKSDEMAMYSPKTNFSFEYCDARFFLAYRDGKIVGRIGRSSTKWPRDVEREENPHQRGGFHRRP
jgi:hypothetical protein